MKDAKNSQKDAYALILDAIDVGVYRPGDRLVESELAERFGVSTKELADFNAIADVHAIQVGQELAIPPTTAAPATTASTAATTTSAAG